MRTPRLAPTLGLALVVPLALAAVRPRPEPVAAHQPVLRYWSASLKPDSGGTATAFLVRFIKHVRTAQPQMNVRVLTNDFGPNDTIHWFEEHESLAARIQAQREREGDLEWEALIGEAWEIFDLENDVLVDLFPLGGAGSTDWSKPVQHLWITRTPPDRKLAARRLAGRVVEYLEANYEALDARAYSADADEPGAIYWMVDYESSDTWEAVRAELLADDAYAQLLAEGEGLFVEEPMNVLLKNF